MTVIAYRDGVMAADTAITIGGSAMGGTVMKKIARNAAGDLAAAAGGAVYAHQFLQWFVEGEKGAPPMPKSTQDAFDRGLICRASKVIQIYEESGFYELDAEYFAIGSGKSEALGAMAAGADAIEAAKAAIKHDPHCGGEIIVIRHEAA